MTAATTRSRQRQLEKFARIYQRACDRKGGEAALKKLLPKVRGARALRNMGKDTFVITGNVTHCLQRA